MVDHMKIINFYFAIDQHWLQRAKKRVENILKGKEKGKNTYLII